MTDQNTGALLAHWMRLHVIPISKVATYTGATRATVYNWLSGKGISPAYRSKVHKYIDKLQARKIK